MISLSHAFDPPRVVAVPPADAGRGLVRISPTEIRHYPGKGGQQMLVSTDNGETWSTKYLTSAYPEATAMTKESPAIGQNPVTGEFITIEPIYRSREGQGINISEGGIDGKWNRVGVDKDGQSVTLNGILRSPTWVNKNTRILVPGHGNGCWTWLSDDGGLTWEKSNSINAPPHAPGGIHEGTRWNHGMVEATLAEMKNGTIWMLARTAQDQHYESFSSNFGRFWKEARPSRFYGTITMPTLFRMQDGRLLLLWSNTAPLPEQADSTGRGEDVFTNRDTIHAAISNDEGTTWSGFRELILDEHRNDSNYATEGGAGDRGKHQAEVVQLDAHHLLFSCGQHPLHRKLMIMDVRWLYETERRSILPEDLENWSLHQYIKGIKGHCAYNRKPGATIEGDALRVRRIDDPELLSPNQGATWNFPSGQTGVFRAWVRLEKGGAGMQINLCDRWFNPTDHAVPQQSVYTLTLDGEGRDLQGRKIMEPGKKQLLEFTWTACNIGGKCCVLVDGKKTPLELKVENRCPNGVSYVHFYNPAPTTDLAGFSLFATQAKIELPNR